MSSVERHQPPILEEITFEGELIHRTDLPAVARVFRTVSKQYADFDRFRQWCRRAIIEQMDARAEWRVEVDGNFAIVADPPTFSEPVWNIDKLLELRDVLPEDRFNDLVTPIVNYVPDTKALQSIAKRDPQSPAGQIIAAAETRKPKSRNIRVSR